MILLLPGDTDKLFMYYFLILMTKQLKTINRCIYTIIRNNNSSQPSSSALFLSVPLSGLCQVFFLSVAFLPFIFFNPFSSILFFLLFCLFFSVCRSSHSSFPSISWIVSFFTTFPSLRRLPYPFISFLLFFLPSPLPDIFISSFYFSGPCLTSGKARRISFWCYYFDLVFLYLTTCSCFLR